MIISYHLICSGHHYNDVIILDVSVFCEHLFLFYFPVPLSLSRLSPLMEMKHIDNDVRHWCFIEICASSAVVINLRVFHPFLVFSRWLFSYRIFIFGRTAFYNCYFVKLNNDIAIFTLIVIYASKWACTNRFGFT